MNLEKTLYYLTHHSEAIIQWLFFSILILTTLLIARALFGKKSLVGAGMVGDSTEIQSFLQKILDQTAKLESVSLEKMTPHSAADIDTQVQSLKAQLAAREQEMTQLKAGGNGQPSADAGALSVRIKELESKLSEYEILEDDIADLSLYKEENQRLKLQISELQGGASSVIEEQPLPPPAKATSGDEIVAEFAQAVSQETMTSELSDASLQETGDSIADFANAVELEKKMQGEESSVATSLTAMIPEPEPTPAPAPEPVVASTPPSVVASAPPPPAATPPIEGDDLFAEFASPPAEPEALDTDKMMSEMAALVDMGVDTSGGGLDEGIDTEKMAMEATNLTKV